MEELRKIDSPGRIEKGKKEREKRKRRRGIEKIAKKYSDLL